MTAITSYTTTEAVRSCLGIDKSDCPDSYMVDSNLELELLVDLDSWLPTHATIFAEGNAASPTADQKKYRNVLCLYSQWFGAYQIAIRPLTFPQIITDGKNQINRFPKADLERIAALAASKMAQYKGILDEEVNGNTATSTLPIILVSSPDTDPVTEAL